MQQTPGNYIAYPKGYTVSQVFNELTELFEIFEKWYSELNDALNQYSSYNAIINSCEIFISVPIALLDTQFKYVCYSKRLAALTGYDKYVRNSIYLPLEDINYLNSLPDYKSLENKTEVFHYIAVENLLHKNIFYNDTYIGQFHILKILLNANVIQSFWIFFLNTLRSYMTVSELSVAWNLRILF